MSKAATGKNSLNDQQQRFVEEYVKDLNATQAAIRAGYAEKTAHSQGSRLLKNVKVIEAIAKKQKKVAERAELDAAAILQRWADIALADPNELSSIITAPCRYCHGEDHEFQWKTEREFNAAYREYENRPESYKEKNPAPECAGGYGYNVTQSPNPQCPECNGLGQPHTVFRDTTKLSGAAKALFAGVKETQHGIEIKTHDQMVALTNAAKHLKMFVETHEIEAGESLKAMMEDIMNGATSAPLKGE